MDTTGFGYARDSIDPASALSGRTGADTGVDSAATRLNEVPAIPRGAEESDTDFDGHVDQWSVDRDGDGNPELVLRDDPWDGDDRPDQVLSDADDNGVVEFSASDSDGDGRLDIWTYDRNQDGAEDLRYTDANHDGVPDGGYADDNFDGVPDRTF